MKDGVTVRDGDMTFMQEPGTYEVAVKEIMHLHDGLAIEILIADLQLQATRLYGNICLLKLF